jgi:prepilin-type N-terminal cleavage/methylation domain-containing protein
MNANRSDKNARGVSASMPCRRAFTLVEVLVTIAIVAILAAMAFGVSKKAIDASKRTKCVTNLKTIYMYLQAYAQDHNNVMPIGIPAEKTYRNPTKLLAELEPYVPNASDRSVFYCPAHYRSPGVLNGYNPTRWASGDFSYFYMQRAGSRADDPRRGFDLNMAVIMSDPFNNNSDNPVGFCHSGGFNIMRLNGAVEFVKNNTSIKNDLLYAD